MRAILFSIMVAIPIAASAQDVGEKPAAFPESAAAVADAPKAVKIICVRGQAETGSHFGATKVCHTQSEWDMIHAQTERGLQRYNASQNAQQPGGGR